jgi:SlyX protein
MTDSLQPRLDRLEVLYSEQDYIIQALNDTISQQDRELTRLNLNLEQLRMQMQSLRSELSPDINSGSEQPPHY